jgi:urease accessory protein
MTWHATLDLHFRADAPRTTLARRHTGPLVVQKALYPEGPGVCHAIVVHPPGGIAGGDRLTLAAHAADGAHGLLTTPGATRWYKAAGRPAAQHVSLRVDGRLEWLPQETLVFDAAEVASTIDIDVGPRGATVGWDVVALGRQAAGEAFANGCFAQTIRLVADGQLQWIERTRIVGGDRLLDSPVGLDGHRVFGCLWAWGPAWSEEALAEVRAALATAAPDVAADAATPAARAGVTLLAPRLLVARALGGGTACVREALAAVWSAVRPAVVGLAATPPRIWAT